MRIVDKRSKIHAGIPYADVLKTVHPDGFCSWPLYDFVCSRLSEVYRVSGNSKEGVRGSLISLGEIDQI